MIATRGWKCLDSKQQARKKSVGISYFVHALLELAAWLQAGEDRAIAAGSKAD
jgi:hypothetical protein